MKLTIALFALTLSAQSGPQGSFIGNDFRRAYVPNTTLNGAGQVIGIYAMANYSPLGHRGKFRAGRSASPNDPDRATSDER